MLSEMGICMEGEKMVENLDGIDELTVLIVSVYYILPGTRLLLADEVQTKAQPQFFHCGRNLLRSLFGGLKPTVVQVLGCRLQLPSYLDHYVNFANQPIVCA